MDNDAIVEADGAEGQGTGSRGELGVLTDCSACNNQNCNNCECNKDVQRPELNAGPLERHRCTTDSENTTNPNALACG